MLTLENLLLAVFEKSAAWEFALLSLVLENLLLAVFGKFASLLSLVFAVRDVYICCYLLCWFLLSDDADQNAIYGGNLCVCGCGCWSGN